MSGVGFEVFRFFKPSAEVVDFGFNLFFQFFSSFSGSLIIV